MRVIAFFMLIMIIMMLPSCAGGITISYSDQVSGNGSFNKKQHIENLQNDRAEVFVDVVDARNYSYSYSLVKDSNHTLAAERVNAAMAKSARATGSAINRNGSEVIISASVENGSLDIESVVDAYAGGAFAESNISSAEGDLISIIGKAALGSENSEQKMSSMLSGAIHSGSLSGYQGTLLITDDGDVQATQRIGEFGSAVAAKFNASARKMNKSSDDVVGGSGFEQMNVEFNASNAEKLQALQDVRLGKGERNSRQHVDAIAGPIFVSSDASGQSGERSISSRILAGVVSVNQSINGLLAHQDAIGVTGGFFFNSSTEGRNASRSDSNAIGGSGNMITFNENLTGESAGMQIEYEYMPVSYQEKVYDSLYAATAINSSSAGNQVRIKMIAGSAEHFQAALQVSSKEGEVTALQDTNAIAGPLTVIANVHDSAGDYDLSGLIDAGVVNVNQSIGGGEARQISRGVLGGAKLTARSVDQGGKESLSYASCGSGNLLTSEQRAQLKGNATSAFGFEYMPVSYSTGTYDSAILDVKAFVSGPDDAKAGAAVGSDMCEKAGGSLYADLSENPSAVMDLSAESITGKFEQSLEAKGASSSDWSYENSFDGSVLNRSSNATKFNAFNVTMASTCLGGSLSSIGQSIKLNEGGAGSKAASSWGRSWSIGSDDAYRAVDTIKLEDEAFSYKGALTGRETDCSKRY